MGETRQAPPREPSGRPSRYQRSAGGLVAALIVTVVAVGAVLWVLGLFRSDLEVEPEQVDYLAVVEEAQDSRLRPVYPTSLPEGWLATGVDVEAGEHPVFQIRLLTDEQRFIGVRQEDAPVSGLLEEHVDAETTPIAAYSADGSVAPAWQGYVDEGGDTAYVAEVGGQVVLVWGSASEGDLQRVIDRLSRAPVE